MNNNRNQGGQRAKLEYVYTKSTFMETVPDDKSGGDSKRLILYLDKEQAYQLGNLILNTADQGRDGIRFTTYTGEKVNRETNETFDSTAISVQPFQKKDNSNGGGNDRGNRRPQGRTGGGFQNNNRNNNANRSANTGRRSAPAAPDTTDTNPEPASNKAEGIPF